jgi:dynein heavy chain, axonemal
MIHAFEKDFDFEAWKSEAKDLAPIKAKLKELRSWE